MKKDNFELIFKTASRLFLTEGYFRTTTKRLAKECKLAEGTIYRYFENKDDLFIQVLNEFHRGFMKQLSDSIHEDNSARNNLQSLIRVHLKHIKENPEINNLFQGEARFLHTSQKIELTNLLELLISLIANIFEWGKERKEVRPEINSRDIAYAYFGIMDMFIIKSETNYKLGLKAESEEIIKVVTMLIFDGIATR